MQSNEQTATIYQHPILGNPPTDDKPPKPSWVIWLCNVFGVIDMPNTPRIWGFNPAVVTLISMLVLTIGGGGYYLGHQAAIIENIQKQADAANEAAKKAKDIALGAEADQEPSPTPTKERKK